MTGYQRSPYANSPFNSLLITAAANLANGPLGSKQYYLGRLRCNFFNKILAVENIKILRELEVPDKEIESTLFKSLVEIVEHEKKFVKDAEASISSQEKWIMMPFSMAVRKNLSRAEKYLSALENKGIEGYLSVIE